MKYTIIFKKEEYLCDALSGSVEKLKELGMEFKGGKSAGFMWNYYDAEIIIPIKEYIVDIDDITDDFEWVTIWFDNGVVFGFVGKNEFTVLR